MNVFENIFTYLDSLELEDFDNLKDYYEDEHMDKQLIIEGFQRNSSSTQTEEALKLLEINLSGCGGTEGFITVTENDALKLKDMDNAGRIQWLKERINILDYHHDDDWSSLICTLLKIDNRYLLNSFMPG